MQVTPCWYCSWGTLHNRPHNKSYNVSFEFECSFQQREGASQKLAIVILNKLLVHYWVKLRSDWFIACNLTLVRWKFNCEKSLSAIFPNTRQLTDCFSWSFKIFFWNFQLGTSKWDGQKPFVRVKDKRCDTVQCETGIETTICKWLLTCLAISHHGNGEILSYFEMLIDFSYIKNQ